MGRKPKADDYAENSCIYCLYWQGRKKGCRLGEDNCILEQEEKPEKESSPCDRCPYAKPNPCIGYCLRKIRQETLTRWSGKGGDRHVEIGS